MSTKLREELDALADTQTFSPDPAAWDRGRRARRNARVVRAAAAVAVVALVVGVGALAVRPDREAPQPAGVPGGAIPSRIPEPSGEVLTDLAVGRASVAYVDEAAQPVLVDAATGDAHRVELPDFPDADAFEVFADHLTGSWLALSPDGTRVAYPTASVYEARGRGYVETPWFRTVDLVTGASELVEPPQCGSTPWAMTWTTDGRIAIDVMGRPSFEEPDPPVVSCAVDPSGRSARPRPLVGVTAPGGDISATFAGADLRYTDLADGGPPVDTAVDAVPFVTSSGADAQRDLPSETYPDGASVRPIGWADDSLLVAQVGDDLVLLTSPDRPESEWVWHTLVEHVPDSLGTSVAVDLVPDLDGDPEQELTHDFGD
ncbi:hypothetical protein F4692_001144 [Nocardioides cavernae]|uniref:Uncharacterized protein n=1 Tax=Nocardioides cavernae TaxID=1921566 RepID=A0A7Y9KQX2_9ACTN|nr:hypothetical protein [Nocardioides cavernae]NYE36040.1 hypothetical protein [Nocardioides cavernae]